MPSTLGYALLALLVRRDRTGYELRQAMHEPVGFLWTASHSQIYPELARLEAAGLVEHAVIDGPGPRDTKRYRVTDEGRARLASWSVEPPDPVPNKDPFMLKVYSMWTADPAGAVDLVTERLTDGRAMLARFEQIEREMLADPRTRSGNPMSPEFCDYATLRAGLSYERHRIAWCEWVLESLRGGGAP